MGWCSRWACLMTVIRSRTLSSRQALLLKPAWVVALSYLDSDSGSNLPKSTPARSLGRVAITERPR